MIQAQCGSKTQSHDILSPRESNIEDECIYRKSMAKDVIVLSVGNSR
jgi:hypothetical protein